MKFPSSIDGWLIPVMVLSFVGIIVALVAVVVAPTRNPLLSPALSMDRLKVSYGKCKSILMSPADKEGFLRAIRQAGVTYE
jgi:hypothetical protein